MEIALGDRSVTSSTTIDLMWSKAEELGLKDGLLHQTSRQVVTDIIKPVTREDKCSFHEWVEKYRTDLTLQPDYEYVRERNLTGSSEPSKVFVSHSWSGKFRDVMYLPQYLYGAPGTISDKALWVDVFVVNHHNDLAKQLDQIEEAIKRCERTVLILDEEWIALTRPWCVYELGITLREKRPIDVAFGGPTRYCAVLDALVILLGHGPDLDIVAKSVGDQHIVERIESSKVDVEMVKQAVRLALFEAARNEVTNKAHLPKDVEDKALNLIKEIGWQHVRNSGAERQRVIGILAGHVHYS